MAVAFDAASESHTGTTDATSVGTFSWTHTPVGTPRGIVVFTINRNTSNDICSAVTYGGVSMTAVSSGFASDTAGEVGACKAWFLGASIPTGNQTVEVTRTNNANGTYGVCFSVTAATDTELKGTPAVINEDSTIGQVAVDSGAATAIRFAAVMAGGSNVPGAGAQSTAGPSIDFGTRVHASAYETTPGSGSRNVGFATVASDDCALVAIAVGEVAGGGESHSGTLVVTGGGIITAAQSTNRNRAGVLTGGGVVTPAQTTNRNRAGVLTGGGVLVVTGSASSGAENHDATFVLTGGGVLVVAASEGATRAAILTGGGVINWAELTGRLAAVQLTGGGQLVIMGGQDVALSDLGAVMCAIGDALEAADVGGGRVFCYPPDSIDAPACVVGYPSVIEFDATMQRGADRLVIPVYFLTGRTSDRAAQQRIAGVITSAAGVKDAVDGNLGGAVDTARVQDMRVLRVNLAGVEYLSAVFNVEAYV